VPGWHGGVRVGLRRGVVDARSPPVVLLQREEHGAGVGVPGSVAFLPEEAVNEVKRQAMSELQKAVSDAERKAHELITTERAKMERALAEAKRQASEDALTVINQQEDSSEVGAGGGELGGWGQWQCGRLGSSFATESAASARASVGTGGAEATPRDGKKRGFLLGMGFMIQDGVHSPGWGCTVWDGDAQSRTGMHSLGRCTWPRLGGRGPGWGSTVWDGDAQSGMMCMAQTGRTWSRMGEHSLVWGCTVWDDVHGPDWEDVVRDRGARSGMGMHGLG